MARLHRFAPRVAAAALAIGLGIGAAAAPLSTASAANDSWRYHNWHGNYRHDWDHHYGGFYFTTPGYYYTPPPAYYYPPPVYTAPPPYYGPSFGLSVHVH